MILYADSSLLVKRYLVEAGADQVQPLLAPPTTIGTALITRAEVAAALAKATRQGVLAQTDAIQNLREFRDNWSALVRLRLNEAVVAQADELAWAHSLRGYDAVHLASALSWQSALGETLTLGTFDRQLWLAAQTAGLAVWPAALA